MKSISVAVLVAVLAAGLMAGCAGTTQTTATPAPYQMGYSGVQTSAEQDPTYTMGNPFRLAALILYPVGVFLQRVVEVPYAVAARIDPSLWGIGDFEQQYLYERWGVRPGPSPDAQPPGAR